MGKNKKSYKYCKIEYNVMGMCIENNIEGAEE